MPKRKPKPVRPSELPPLEQRIRDDKLAREAFETLKARGADEDELWRCLDCLETSQILGFASWSKRSKLTKRQAKDLVQRLNADAGKIRAFFTPDLYWYLTVQLKRFGWLELVQRHLRLTARLIEELRSSDDRGALDERPAKTRLTEYVLKATRKPHDKEVADLICVTLNRDDYTAEEQRKFRKRPTKTGHN